MQSVIAENENVWSAVILILKDDTEPHFESIQHRVMYRMRVEDGKRKTDRDKEREGGTERKN